MRTAVAFALVATLGLAAVATQGRLPLKQNLEILTEGPMRADRVKDGLYVIRGPFLPCMRGCPPGQTGDGLIHESGDVALRVTPAGLIVVDDKFPDQATEVLAQVKKVSPLPVRYVLNSHHHADHVSGNATVRSALGVDIIGHRNIRENFLRLKQAGEPTITFDDQTSIFLGGVEVRLLWLGRGHTNGDTVIYFPDLKTVHVGDLIIDGMPVIDYPGGGAPWSSWPPSTTWEGPVRDPRSGAGAVAAVGSRLGPLGQHHDLVRRVPGLLRRAGPRALSGQCETPDDRVEPWIAADGLRPRQQHDADHVAHVLVERPLQALEQLIVFAEPGVHQREVERRRVLARGVVLQARQHGARLVLPSGDAERLAQVAEPDAPAGRVDGRAQRLHRILDVPFGKTETAKVKVRQPERRVEHERGLQLLDGLRAASQQLQRIGVMAADDR